MSLGTGIVLFVIGAILAFAVHVQVAWVNLQVVGYILMVAGAVGIILGIVLIATRRTRSVSESRSFTDPATGERVQRSTTDHRDDPYV
jgi:membrane-bound ClpP family serine protease